MCVSYLMSNLPLCPNITCVISQISLKRHTCVMNCLHMNGQKGFVCKLVTTVIPVSRQYRLDICGYLFFENAFLPKFFYLVQVNQLGTTGSKDGFCSEGRFRAAEKFNHPRSANEKVQDFLQKCVIRDKMEASLIYRKTGVYGSTKCQSFNYQSTNQSILYSVKLNTKYIP